MLNHDNSVRAILELVKTLDRSLSHTQFILSFDEEINILRNALKEELPPTHAAFTFEQQLNEEAFIRKRLQMVLKGLKRIFFKLEDELYRELNILEKEMHGMQNFSNYENGRIKNYLMKISFREKLTHALTMIEQRLIHSPYYHEQSSV